MRAVLVESLGPPQSHRVAELPDPIPGPGEVVVDVKAAALNFPDLLMMQGLYQVRPDLPFIPGNEGAGVVAALGPDVTGVAVGDRVVFVAAIGAFAEKIRVPTATLLPVPNGMDDATAAAFTLTYATGYHALVQRAQLKAGENLLVLGAAGGVGSAAVELGVALGARVIAAAGSAEKLDFARDLGAAAAINYTTADIKEQARTLTDGAGPDVVYDPVGGALTEPALRSLTWGGRYLVIGFAAGDIPRIPLNVPLLKSLDVVGVYWGAWAGRNPRGNRENYERLAALFEDGAISPRVTARYPLDRFAAACEELGARRAMGKVVLELS